MNNLNNEFFDEFKQLDALCRDIYGKSSDNKLGVTMYLEDMDKKSYQGSYRISGWNSDYDRLKKARNTRNELAHSRNSFSDELCSKGDVDFIRAFKERILNQTAPIALLRKQNDAERAAVKRTGQHSPKPPQVHVTPNPPKTTVNRQARQKDLDDFSSVLNSILKWTAVVGGLIIALFLIFAALIIFLTLQ